MRTSVAAVLLLATVIRCNASPGPQDCTEKCLVRIEGVQPFYSKHSRSNLVVYNESKQDLDLNVAAEELQSGSWVELSASVSDPRHVFSKTIMFRTVKPESSFTLAFTPCDIQIPEDKAGHAVMVSLCSSATRSHSAPPLLRLRVDVFNRSKGQIVQRVLSQEFRFQM